MEYNTSTNPTFEGAARDTSGRGNDGIINSSVTYDSTSKEFNFAGDNDWIESPALGWTGAQPHSVSVWIKLDVMSNPNSTSIQNAWTIRKPNSTDAVSRISELHIFSNGTIEWAFNGNNNTTAINKIGVGQYYHIVCVYNGGGGNAASSRRMWINGVEETFATVSSTASAINFYDTATFAAGYDQGLTNYDLDGKMSSIKLYDTALTAEEVKTLYDMGRTGSVANPQPLHIAAPLQVEKSLSIPVDDATTGSYTTGMLRYNPSLSKIQVFNGSTWLTIGGVSATGGTTPITYADGYTIHTFTSSGTFTVVSGGDVEYLVVAGGGGGGRNAGSGGGAGGMVTGSVTITPGSYTLTLGEGGPGGDANNDDGTNGNDSTIPGVTRAYGGGHGVSTGIGGDGGSGGGGSNGGGASSGGSGTAGQGNNGGNGNHPGGVDRAAAGGGGAGARGGDSVSSSKGGSGGIGVISTIRGTGNIYYAGGGGGACHSTATGGSGGSGGGGKGGNSTGSASGAQVGTDGSVNTGGGGGGGAGHGASGGAGGRGIVIIRYLS